MHAFVALLYVFSARLTHTHDIPSFPQLDAYMDFSIWIFGGSDKQGGAEWERKA